MNKKIQSKFGPYPILIMLLCTVACTLRTVATFLGVNEFGYFESSTLFRVSVWITVAAILLALTLPLAYRKRSDALVEQTTPHTFLPSLMLGMLLLLFVGEKVFPLIGTFFVPTIDNLTLLLSIVLAAISSIYFFSLAILESTKNDRKANFGMACVLFFGVYAAYLYLDTTVPRNAHIELSEEMTYVALSLYFLYEVRVSLGKQKQNLYITFAMIAAVLCSYCVIPSLIYYVATGRLLASSLSAFLLLLGSLLFILLRLALFEKSPADAPIPLVERLVKMAAARADAVAAQEALFAPTPIEPQPTEVPEGEEAEVQETIPTESEEIEAEEAPVPEVQEDEPSQAQDEEAAVLTEEATILAEKMPVEEAVAVEAPATEDTPLEEVTATEAPVSEVGVPEREEMREFDFTSEEIYAPQDEEQSAEPCAEQSVEQTGEITQPKEESNEEDISN